jgi:hypothetical protein
MAMLLPFPRKFDCLASAALFLQADISAVAFRFAVRVFDRSHREQIKCESGNLFVVSEVKYKLIYPGQPLLQFFILCESEYLLVRSNWF